MQIYHNVIACLAQATQYLPESLLRFQEQQTVHTWIGAQDILIGRFGKKIDLGCRAVPA
jgi:hypothetical protein